MGIQFFVEYVKNFRGVGAVAPSSRHLTHKMLESIDFDTAKIIVEYGPGTGVFTAEIVKRMTSGSKLIIVETNQSFNLKLSHAYAYNNTVEVINDSAENIESILKKRNIRTVDYIVSGLPFAALPAKTSHSILQSTTKLLGQQGTFITFQYTLLKQDLFRSFFNDITITREFRNLPPAYVLFCTNK